MLSRPTATTDIHLHAPALVPNDYCVDVHLRLIFYKKLANVKTSDQIDALLEEPVGPFGKLTPRDPEKQTHIKLAGNDKIRIERELPDPKARAQMVRDVLRSLGQPKTETLTA